MLAPVQSDLRGPHGALAALPGGRVTGTPDPSQSSSMSSSWTLEELELVPELDAIADLEAAAWGPATPEEDAMELNAWLRRRRPDRIVLKPSGEECQRPD